MSATQDAYDRFCIERYPLPTEKDIAELESRLHTSLPNSYRKYLISYNGGSFRDGKVIYPEPITVNWRGMKVTHDGNVIQILCGVNAPYDYAVLGKRSDVTLFEGNSPLQLLRIGNTIENHLILIDLLPESSGQILVKFIGEKAYPVAEDIDDFFSLVQVDQHVL